LLVGTNIAKPILTSVTAGGEVVHLRNLATFSGRQRTVLTNPGSLFLFFNIAVEL
jgi:hypothetical protein